MTKDPRKSRYVASEMVKSELALRLAARNKHLVHKDAQIAVDLIIGAMIDALVQGRRIELRDFGSFSLRQGKPRKARNPRTGAEVYVQSKPKIYFRSTGELKQRVNASLGKTDARSRRFF